MASKYSGWAGDNTLELNANKILKIDTDFECA